MGCNLSWTCHGQSSGEVCVRHKTLSRLGVTIRRVRSNIHDNRFLLPRLRFFPLRAAFEAADAELLTLLVQPLYGDDANFGIHELIQNPVDACLERQDVGHHDQAEILAQSEQEVDIAVSIDTKNGVHYLTISDKGIGMTANTECEYFLRAGAFYRRSDSWRKLHEPDGLSRPLRSGRFGSGVLAGFVLSDEIKVSTRHLYATEMEGVEFSASLDAELIELVRCSRPVGTTIEIKLFRGVFQQITTALMGQLFVFGRIPDLTGLVIPAKPPNSRVLSRRSQNTQAVFMAGMRRKPAARMAPPSQ